MCKKRFKYTTSDDISYHVAFHVVCLKKNCDCTKLNAVNNDEININEE